MGTKFDEFKVEVLKGVEPHPFAVEMILENDDLIKSVKRASRSNVESSVYFFIGVDVIFQNFRNTLMPSRERFGFELIETCKKLSSLLESDEAECLEKYEVPKNNNPRQPLASDFNFRTDLNSIIRHLIFQEEVLNNITFSGKAKDESREKSKKAHFLTAVQGLTKTFFEKPRHAVIAKVSSSDTVRKAFGEEFLDEQFSISRAKLNK